MLGPVESHELAPGACNQTRKSPGFGPGLLCVR
jgi:hypothetical protein